MDMLNIKWLDNLLVRTDNRRQLHLNCLSRSEYVITSPSNDKESSATLDCGLFVIKLGLCFFAEDCCSPVRFHNSLGNMFGEVLQVFLEIVV